MKKLVATYILIIFVSVGLAYADDESQRKSQPAKEETSGASKKESGSGNTDKDKGVTEKIKEGIEKRFKRDPPRTQTGAVRG
jgi:hypothetical protein